MFTKLDKAIAALIMAVIFILNTLFNLNLGVEEELLASIAMVATAILVYFVPNKN